MKKKQINSKLQLLILLTLLLILLTSFALGKYIKTVPLRNSVTFTATLAEKVTLAESKISRKTDGTDETTAETVANEIQAYTLMPGVDIPKDPHIIIEGKTEIPAYLYIEVRESVPNTAIVWNIEDHWLETDKLEPQTEGNKVYVYCTDGVPQKITTDLTVYILEGNTVTVNQALLHGDNTNLLAFDAYLIEATD